MDILDYRLVAYHFSILRGAFQIRQQFPCRLGGVIYCEDTQIYVCGCPDDPLGQVSPLSNSFLYSYEELDNLITDLESNSSLIWLYAPHGPFLNELRKSPGKIEAQSVMVTLKGTQKHLVSI